MGTFQACTIAAIIPAAAGRGHAHKIAQPAGRHAVHVEARQPPGAAEGKCQAHQPCQIVDVARFGNIALRDGAHSPGVGQNRRRNSKADHVRQGIELLAELGIGVSDSRNETVECVEDNSETDCSRRIIQIYDAALHRRQHGIKPAQQIADGKGAGQQVNAAPQPMIARLDESEFLLVRFFHRHRASTLTPPATCWPGRRHNFGILRKPDIHARTEPDQPNPFSQFYGRRRAPSSKPRAAQSLRQSV